MGDLITKYLDYTSFTEVPAFFNRWCAMAGIGALLGRQFYFNHGHFKINPNIYAMLIGSPGTRKGTAIKTIKHILTQSGYHKFSGERTSKEKFLLDLAGEGEEQLESVDDILDKNLWGPEASSPSDPREMFIAIDEINDFLGNGNIEFISMLGNMWDYSGAYQNRIKTGKSVTIQDPTISLLGGNTPTGFSLAFPTEVIGQGFFSRLILVYGEPNGKRIAFPKAPPAEETQAIINYFKSIKDTVIGPARLDSGAERLLESIYNSNTQLEDVRFEAYSNRRFTHLLKLCLIVSASRVSRNVTEADVIYANTILSHTELFMPKALGEFGAARSSGVSHKVIQAIYENHGPMKFKDIWPHVQPDLENMQQLATILQNLVEAQKLQSVPGGHGYLPKRRAVDFGANKFVNIELLTPEERNMKR